MAASKEDTCFSETSSRTENPDDWLFDSIKMYDNLHMFELQHPTELIEWMGENYIWVACCQSTGKTEILQLELPGKFLSGDSLGPERDFSVVCGGFSDNKIEEMKHLPHSGCLVTGQAGSNGVAVWRSKNETSGLLQKEREIANTVPSSAAARIAILEDDSDCVIFGTSLADIHVVDAQTSDIVYSSKDLDASNVIDRILSTGSKSFMASMNNGQVWQFDTRQKPGEGTRVIDRSPNGSTTWNSDRLHQEDGSSSIIQISESGEVRYLDCRRGDRPICECKTGLKCEGGGNVRIRWSKNGDSFSVSGFNGKVYIYQKADLLSDHSSSDSKSPAKNDVMTPVFTHQGHEACAEVMTSVKTLTHICHPSVPRSLLSSASDGSLHVWQYVVPS